MIQTNNNSNNKAEQSKIDIVRLFAINGNLTISEIAKTTTLSVPTVSKFINELIDGEYVYEVGKSDESIGGRKPTIYGLNPSSAYFVGIDIRRYSLSIGIIDINGKIVYKEHGIDYSNANTSESLDELCDKTLDFLDRSQINKDKVLAFSLNMSGRVNSQKGVSYTTFNFTGEDSLCSILEKKLGATTYIENDSRALCYAEYNKGVVKNEKNILFINITWGLGMGMILDGKLYYGTSGFSGEFGHMPFFNNEVFCHCGKKGCMETEASGSGMYRILKMKHQAGAVSILSPKLINDEPIRTEDLVEAALKEDILMIEIVEEIGSNLGKGIAGLINIFNPELVIIGGVVATVGDYLLLPIKSGIKKYSINLVSQDTQIVLSELKGDGGIIGAAFIARNRTLGIL